VLDAWSTGARRRGAGLMPGTPMHALVGASDRGGTWGSEELFTAACVKRMMLGSDGCGAVER